MGASVVNALSTSPPCGIPRPGMRACVRPRSEGSVVDRRRSVRRFDRDWEGGIPGSERVSVAGARVHAGSLLTYGRICVVRGSLREELEAGNHRGERAKAARIWVVRGSLREELEAGNHRRERAKAVRICVVRGSLREELEAGNNRGERAKAARDEGGLEHREGVATYASGLFKEVGFGIGAKESGEGRGAPEASIASAMAGMFDLEKQFAFYGSYHTNRVNVIIHMIFVWPILFTSSILLAYTPPLAPLPLPGGTLPLQQFMVLNFSFVTAAVYALYYVALDKKAGSLGAALCLGCWIGSNAVAQALPWSFGWKVVVAANLFCWVAQIYGHQKFEGRAPAFLDNVSQALLLAPFFVLLEFLQSFGYEPYPGFRQIVEKNVDENVRQYRASKEKKAV